MSCVRRRNGPAILQAGTSPKGPGFRGQIRRRHLCHPAHGPRMPWALLRERQGTRDESGPRPRSLTRILFGMQPVIGSTETRSAARKQEGAQRPGQPLDGGKAILSAHKSGFRPLRGCPMTQSSPSAQEEPGEAAAPGRSTWAASGEPMTLAEVAAAPWPEASGCRAD